MRSHWPDGHWSIPLAPLADNNGYLPVNGQWVPQEVIDRLAELEDKWEEMGRDADSEILDAERMWR